MVEIIAAAAAEANVRFLSKGIKRNKTKVIMKVLYKKLPNRFPKWLYYLAFPPSAVRVPVAPQPQQHFMLSVLILACLVRV